MNGGSAPRIERQSGGSDMMAKIIESFRSGDSVPTWLIDQEPTSPDAKRARITFAADCHVVETSCGYFVVPDALNCVYSIRVEGAVSIKLRATSLPVAMLTATCTMHPEGLDNPPDVQDVTINGDHP